MNPIMFLQLKNSWDTFKKKHPKFPLFLKKISTEAILENSIIEIHVTTPEGKTYSSNLKVTKTDVELVEQIKELFENSQS